MTMWLEKFIRICHESLGLNEMSDSITPLFETCGDDNFCENLMCEQTKEKTWIGDHCQERAKLPNYRCRVWYFDGWKGKKTGSWESWKDHWVVQCHLKVIEMHLSVEVTQTEMCIVRPGWQRDSWKVVETDTLAQHFRILILFSEEFSTQIFPSMYLSLIMLTQFPVLHKVRF